MRLVKLYLVDRAANNESMRDLHACASHFHMQSIHFDTGDLPLSGHIARFPSCNLEVSKSNQLVMRV